MRFNSFFNQVSSTRQVFQLLNAAVVTLAVYNYLTDPHTNGFRVAHEIVTGVVTYIALQEQAGLLSYIGNFSGNVSQLGALYEHATSGFSTTPLGVDAMRAGFHTANMLVQLLTDDNNVTNDNDGNEFTPQ